MGTLILPSLVEFNGDWNEYEDILYSIYLDKIVNPSLSFEGKPVKYERDPTFKDRDHSFWHITSTGPNEDERTPDLRRCKRLKWVAWIINNYKADERISWWINKRGSNKHVVMWFDDETTDESFAVILKKRSNQYRLKSAYCVDGHRRQAFINDRERYKLSLKQQKPPQVTASNAPSTHGR